MHSWRWAGVSVSVIGQTSLTDGLPAKLLSEKLVDFELHVSGLAADQCHRTDRIARGRHFEIGLVLVVPVTDGPQVVLIVSPALTDRDHMVDLQPALLAGFAQRFLTRTGTAHLAGVAIAFKDLTA